MDDIIIKYATYENGLPPQPTRMAVPGWGGPPQKMENGSEPQPWHCQPFIEGTTYGLELVYQHETECHVVNEGGVVRFEWNFRGEPGGQLTGGEFQLFAPVQAAKYYLFNPRIDVRPPAGYVVRSEPHPRYYTDETGNCPLAMVAHLQNEWYPRLLFVVFRAPWPGQRHIFRQGEPYAQLLFLPQVSGYRLEPMPEEEAEQRRQLERDLMVTKADIAENVWQNPDGAAFNNHYKVLSRAFTRDGEAGVAKEIKDAVARRAAFLAQDRPTSELMALGKEQLRKGDLPFAHAIYAHILQREPNHAEALSQVGHVLSALGDLNRGLGVLSRAAALAPESPQVFVRLGEWLGRAGRHAEAEAALRRALQLQPQDAEALTYLGIVLTLQRRFEPAVEAMLRGVSLAPTPERYYRLAWTLTQYGRTKEARGALDNALRLDPFYSPALRAREALAAP